MTRHVTSELSAHSVSQTTEVFFMTGTGGGWGGGGGREKWKEWRERDE